MEENQREPIYQSIDDNADELSRAMRVCLMGSDIYEPLTFAPSCGAMETFAKEWGDWRCELFDAILAQHLIHVYRLSQSGDARGIIVLDSKLHHQLEPGASDRSIMAGSQFHASMDGAKHVKALDKLRKAVLDQSMPGHHATFFACEAAAFNVPMIHLFPAFLFAEWRNGKRLANVTESAASIDLFHHECREDLAAARKVFSLILGGENTLSVCA